MRKRRVWLSLVAVLLLGTAVLVALFEPTRTIRGFLAGEPFYRGRPASYWREVLRECGRSGSVPRETAVRFRSPADTLPVLRVLARDPDSKVRWPAIALLGQGDCPTQPGQAVLIDALEDEAAEVRLQAIRGLALWGSRSRPAFGALTARLRDTDLQVAHAADLALWQIDGPAAVVACGWRPFVSPEFGFAVALPGQPEREDKRLFDGQVAAHSFETWHRVGTEPSPTRYVVLVAEYRDEVLKESTEEQRFGVMKDLAPVFFPGGKVVEEKEASLGNLRGREHVLEVAGMGRVRSRVFWVGRRLYAVLAAYQPKFVNVPAMDYFLNSLRLEPKAEKPARPHAERPHSSP